MPITVGDRDARRPGESGRPGGAVSGGRGGAATRPGRKPDTAPSRGIGAAVGRGMGSLADILGGTMGLGGFIGGKIGGVFDTPRQTSVNTISGGLGPIGPSLERAFAGPGMRGQRGGRDGYDPLMELLAGRRMGRKRVRPGTFEPDEIALPSILNFDSDMSDLQRRTAIATGGVAALPSYYRDREVMDYYRNLLMRNMISGTKRKPIYGDMESLMPVEQQYLQQVFGISDFNDMQGLMEALQNYQYA